MKLSNQQVNALTTRIIENLETIKKERENIFLETLQQEEEYNKIKELQERKNALLEEVECLAIELRDIVGLPYTIGGSYLDKYKEKKVKEFLSDFKIDEAKIKNDIIISTIELEEGSTIEDIIASITEKYINR